MIIAGAAWLPLILTAIEFIIRQRSLGGRPATWPWLTLGAIALGCQILAGHVEITYYTLLVSGAYSAWRLITEWLSYHKAHQENTKKTFVNFVTSFVSFVVKHLRQAGALLAMVIFGLALGAIQFIPLFELVQHNFRSGSATFEQIVGWAYPVRHALAFLIPNIYGNPSHHAYFDLFTEQWAPVTVNALGDPITAIDFGQTPFKNYVEGGAYLGLLPLLLMPLVAYQWLKLTLSKEPIDYAFRSLLPSSFFPLTPFFLILAFFSLAFAFGTPLYALIFWLPGINQVHSPFRWVWPLLLCAAVLSAYGVEYLWRSHQPPTIYGYGLLQRKKKTSPLTDYVSRFTSPLFLWSAPSLVTFLGGLAFWSGLAIVGGLIVARIWYEPLGVARLMDTIVAEVSFATRMFKDGRMAFSYEAWWTAIFGLMLMASGIVLRISRCRIYVRGRTIWEPLALGVIALDLFVAGWGFNPSADPAILTYVPPAVEFLRQDTGLWRFTTYDTRGTKPFNANLGWYFNFYDVRGYDSIFPMQYRRYMEAIQPQGELDFNRIAPISDSAALDSPLLDLLNVKYVITEEEIANPKYTLVYSAEVRIYQNQTVLPRAYLAPLTSTLFYDDFAQAIRGDDPRQNVFVDFRATDLTHRLPNPAWPTPVEIIQYTPNEVTLAADVHDPAWLVLTDSYFSGWKAFVHEIDSQTETEVPITLVNGNFRGVRLLPGAWQVRFKYSPDSFKLGGLISFLSFITLIFGLGVWAWRYFYQESAADSTARRVAKNSLAPMALNLMNRGIDLIFAAFYLRVLGPDDVGKYYFAVVVFGWFEIITNYGLNTLLTRDVSRDRAHANRYLVNTTILRLLLGIVVIPGLALLLGLRQMLSNPLTADTLWAIGLLVLAQAPATVSTGLSALFYVYEKAEIPAAVATVSTLLKVALGTVALVVGWGFVGLAGVSIVVNVVTLAVLGVVVWRTFFAPRWELDWGLQRSAVRESFPLMLNHLLATLFFKVDVPLLETIRNQQRAGQGNLEVGWYNTAYKFVDAYNVIPSFFTFALFPVMSRQAADATQRDALKRSYALAVKLLVAVALPLAALTAFLAPLMVGILGGREFLPDGAIALSVMVWSIPFGWINSVTNYLLIALGQQRALTRAFAISLLFNIICNVILLPRYGYVAAAAITIASEIFEGAWFYWYLRKSLGPLPWLNWLWRLWASAILMTGAMAALWALAPLLAIVAGVGVYLVSVLALRAFTADERATLLSILPERARARTTGE
jgi:O-antigen/teichoic acid export membrane protein